MNRFSIIKRLKDIKPALCETYGITELALFGSYSRDEATEKSDIDIMIDYQVSMGMRFFDIIYELEEVFKNKKIEVVTRKAIKPKYFDRIKLCLISA